MNNNDVLKQLMNAYENNKFMDMNFSNPTTNVERVYPNLEAMYNIKNEMAKQNENLMTQLDLSKQQNELLSSNYMKLDEMYNIQNNAYKKLQEDLNKSTKFNRCMMIIAIISTLVTIASLIFTVF